MGDLVAFCEARVSEDEAAALESKNAPAGAARFVDADQWSQSLIWLTGEDRMIREVEAKRAILAAHVPYFEPAEAVPDICAVCVTGKDGYAENWLMDLWPCLPVRAIAAIWSDHPDYEEGWKP